MKAKRKRKRKRGGHSDGAVAVAVAAASWQHATQPLWGIDFTPLSLSHT